MRIRETSLRAKRSGWMRYGHWYHHVYVCSRNKSYLQQSVTSDPEPENVPHLVFYDAPARQTPIPPKISRDGSTDSNASHETTRSSPNLRPNNAPFEVDSVVITPHIQFPTPPSETLDPSSFSESTPLPKPQSFLQAPSLERSISNSTMLTFRTAQSVISSGETEFYSLPPSMPETPTADATYSPVGDGEYLSDELLSKLDGALGLVGPRRD